MNMAFFWLLLCICLLYAQVLQGKAFVTVECKPENVGHYGQRSVIECAVKMSQEGVGSKIRKVYWMKDGEKLLVYDEGKLTNKPGYSFAEPSWDVDNMNVSLLISGTALADIGSYRCAVLTESGPAESHSNLKVTASYSPPNVTSEKNTLSCISEGGYPQGELSWYDEHKTELDSKTETKRDGNGVYTLTSKLNVSPGSGTYTCTVVSASGNKQETLFHIEDGVPSHEERKSNIDNLATRIAAPLVVIGSLIVGLLLLLLYKRHRTQARRPSAAPLMGFQLCKTSYTAADQSATEDDTTRHEPV